MRGEALRFRREEYRLFGSFTTPHVLTRAPTHRSMPLRNAESSLPLSAIPSTLCHRYAITGLQTPLLIDSVPKVYRMKMGPHLMVVPYPSQPHIRPMLTLVRQIASHGGIKITFVCHQTVIDRIPTSERNSGDSIQFVGVPDDLPGFDPPKDLPVTPDVLRTSLKLGYCMGPFVDKLLHDQDNLQGPTCMITDAVNWWVTDIAAKLSIPRFILNVFSASMLQIALNFNIGCVFDKDGFMRIPAVPPLQVHHLPGTFRDDYEFRDAFLTLLPNFARECDGVLVNTCSAMESDVLKALADTLQRDIPVLPVGPIGLSAGVPSTNFSTEGLQLSDESTVINWLGEQPPISVLYVSFGTTGLFALAKRHVTELAKGLEESGQRFVWVVRAPPGVDEHDPELLPQGFEERVKGRGLLVRGWAPQLQILAHPSTGGFLSSCGWNSAIESLALGVPVIGWPSFADQPVVSRLLEAKFKVSITLPFADDFFVEAKDLVKAINVVFHTEEGEAMRGRTAQYKAHIGADLAPYGSTSTAILQFANLIKGGLVSH